MNRIELPEPEQTNSGQFWYVGKATTEPFKGRDIRLHYVRKPRLWTVCIVGFTGLPSRYENRKTASGVRALLGKLFDAQAVHLTGWVR